MKKTALLFGATGLIGSHVLNILVADDHYERIKVFLRRQPEKTESQSWSSSKIEIHIVDFNALENFKSAVAGDDIFICIGTTIKTVGGDKAAFRKVDFDIPVNAAHLAAQNNVKGCFIISSLGADAGSNNFYLKTKGEMESAVKQNSFEHLCFLRPSLLQGDRKETRLGEIVGGFFMNALSFLFVGSLRKYKAIAGADVAAAMVVLANMPITSTVYESDKLVELVKENSK